MHKLAENLKFDIEYAGGTLNNSATTATYFSMAHYDKIAFLIQTGTLTSTASLSCQGWQRVGASGTESVLAVSPTVYTTDDGVACVEFSGSDLTPTALNDRIGLVITETGTQNAVVKAVIAVRWNSRYAQASLLS